MKNLLLSAALAAVLALGASSQATPPKREMRANWLTSYINIDWPSTTGRGTSAAAQARAKSDMIKILDNMQAHRFTTVCFHVRPTADVFYKSKLEPWSYWISGNRGFDPGWDPLQFAIDECHKRGMECYAWVNPFRITAKGLTYHSYSTDFDKQWVANGWVLTSGNWKIFNPAIPGAMRHCLDAIAEIYQNYDIDGMLFDDYFYPGDGMDATASNCEDYPQYQAYRNDGGTMGIADWRRDNVNRFVKQLYDEIQAARPDMRWGISPAGIGGASASKYGLSKPSVTSTDWMYAKIYCDPLAWLNDGSIDFISPQIYWGTKHTTAPFGPLCRWWSDVAGHFGRHFYASAGAYRLKETDFGGNDVNGWADVQQQTQLTRQNTPNNAPGMVYYNTSSIDGPTLSGLGNYLEQNVYTRPALPPVITWKQHAVYGAPADLVADGGLLTWTATAPATDKAIIRYSVYAVPATLNLEQAMATDGDGIDGAYLQKVVYGTQYALDADKQNGYWYAVCVLDGYGYESEPATAGLSTTPSEAVTLLAPADGAVADWDAWLEWTPVTNATYTVQIARDADFTDVIANPAGLTEPNYTYSLNAIPDASRLYWRVASTQPGCRATYSASRSFITPTRTPAPVQKLSAPDDGAQFAGDDITFAWGCGCSGLAGIDGYTLQIAKAGSDFAQMVLERDVPFAMEPSLTIGGSVLGIGDFEWRVIAKGQRLSPSTSDVRTFSVTKLDVGGSEPGYTVKTDKASYPAVGKLTLENLWIRAQSSPWSNISFDGKGSYNRGLAATQSHVYMTGRSENTAGASIYLNEYNAFTGELERVINLSSNGQMGYMPCNDVLTDQAGNLCVVNMVTATSSAPIKLMRVDLTDGQLTEVASVRPPQSGRIDHVGLLGNVTTGNFYIFAPISSGTKLVRWTYTDGQLTDTQSRTISDYYPGGSHWAVAPHVWPVSADRVFVDGSTSAMTLYDFNTGAIVGSFANAKALTPSALTDNGCTLVTLGGKRYAAYSSTPSAQGARWNIVSLGDADDYSTMTAMWRVPETTNGMGKVDSATSAAPVVTLPMSDNTAHFYVYSPGNGLAAYRLTDTELGGVTDITVDGAIDAQPVYYNLQGVAVGQPLRGNIYIVRQGTHARKILY